MMLNGKTSWRSASLKMDCPASIDSIFVPMFQLICGEAILPHFGRRGIWAGIRGNVLGSGEQDGNCDPECFLNTSS